MPNEFMHCFFSLFFAFHLGFPKVVLCDLVRFDGEVEKLIINMTFKVFRASCRRLKSLSHDREVDFFGLNLKMGNKLKIAYKFLWKFFRSIEIWDKKCFLEENFFSHLYYEWRSKNRFRNRNRYNIFSLSKLICKRSNNDHPTKYRKPQL